jgi:hypothetical protein
VLAVLLMFNLMPAVVLIGRLRHSWAIWAGIFLPSRRRPSREPHRSLPVVPLARG